MTEQSNQATEKTKSEEHLIPVTQAAPIAKLSASHLRYLVRAGKVAGQKLGRDWFTSKAALDVYLATERKPGPKPNRNDADAS